MVTMFDLDEDQAELNLWDAPSTPTPAPSDWKTTFLPSPRKRSRSCATALSSEIEIDSSDSENPPSPCPQKSSAPTSQDSPVQRGSAPIQALPRELLHKIATCVDSDRDLASLTWSCRKLAHTLLPSDSAVWRIRFLAKYDHPIFDEDSTFCNAYKLRRFVLNNFVDFRDGEDPRLDIELEVIRDMVLETYHQPAECPPTPTTSRNLTAFNSPSRSHWLVLFLSSPFFNYGKQKNDDEKSHVVWTYGEPNILFDALHLTFSHLLLRPKSMMAYNVTASRDNYDVVKVYNWNQPLAVLFYKLPESEQGHIPKQSEPFRSKIFPNLQKTAQPPKAIVKYGIDLNTLLHIRNFWYRHLIDDDCTKIDSVGINEATYSQMAKDLERLGYSPRAWEAPLQNMKANLNSIINHKWFGHYSSIQPWPKKSHELADRQTTAEDWHNDIDPLTLDWIVSDSDPKSHIWPPIFGSIPVFETSTPDEHSVPGKRLFLRGIAPFLDIKTAIEEFSRSEQDKASSPDENVKSGLNEKAVTGTETATAPTKYHPFLALRVRGIVHPIPATLTSAIPGFHRILFIVFKPTSRALIHVLEHDIGEVDNAAQLFLSQQVLDALADPTVQAIMDESDNIITQQQQQPQAAAQAQQPLNLDSAEADRHLRNHLDALLTHHRPFHLQSSTMTAAGIAQMEDEWAGGEYLAWEDMEYAYAYEGVVLPGGKIMLGRYWRCGMAGEGPGKEVDVDGLSVVVEEEGKEGMVEVEIEEEGMERTEKRTTKGLDRGTFCFWTGKKERE